MMPTKDTTTWMFRRLRSRSAIMIDGWRMNRSLHQLSLQRIENRLKETLLMMSYLWYTKNACAMSHE